VNLKQQLEMAYGVVCFTAWVLGWVECAHCRIVTVRGPCPFADELPAEHEAAASWRAPHPVGGDWGEP
jgi:hypothetical protein